MRKTTMKSSSGAGLRQRRSKTQPIGAFSLRRIQPWIGLRAPEERFTRLPYRLPPRLRRLALPLLLLLRTPSPLWLHHRRDNKSSYGSSGF
uniref:Uncharacterized protein n=1 Tax=Fagus sylvatica TaxID=28930 RepID=A0A2N9ICJ6_FAGSY